MKEKISIISLLFITYLNAHANKDTLLLKCLYYENSSGEKGKTTLFYSENHKNYKAKWELKDGSRYSINYHFLNENGNITRKYREFSDSITSNNFYKYNKQGNVIEDYFERSDGVKGIVWYSYKDNRKIEANCRGLNGWFFGNIKYHYKDEKLIKGIIYKEGREIGFIEFTYNEQGNLIKEYWDLGSKWNQTFTYEYFRPEKEIPKSFTYSSSFLKETKESIVKKENYDWNNEEGGPSKYEYEGNKLVRKVYDYDSLKTITTYEYNDQGLLMKSFRVYNDGRKAEFSYQFNENRQLVRRLFHAENGFFGGETYRYDENGKLIEAEWARFDTWLTGTITFDYDENNLLESGFFKGENGFDAKIIFENDSYKNLIKIHWEFTFGKTQTYRFKYYKL